MTHDLIENQKSKIENPPSPFRAAMLTALTAFRRQWLSLLIFAGTVAFFHALVVVSFPAIGGIDAVESVITTFPEGLRTLLKIAPNLQGGFALPDYLAFSWFHPVFLGLGSAFVVTRATNALAAEVETGSIYLRLSRPVPRWAFVLGKAFELYLGAAVLAFSGWLGLALGYWLTPLPPLDLGRYMLIATEAFLLFGALGGGGLMISAGMSRTATAGGVGSAWTLFAFLLDVLPAVVNSPLAVLNPWHHYFPQQTLNTGGVDGVGVLVLVGWMVGSVVGAVWIFGRRDLA